jgi:hypothetical protein
MIALQVQGNIGKRHGVAINIERSDRMRSIAILFGLLQLAKEKLGEI